MKVETTAEQLLFTTVRIHWSPKPNEQATGTAFFYSYPIGNREYLFLVTNRHVVAGASATSITFHTAREGVVQLGKPFELTVTDAAQYWHLSQDPEVDLAIGPAAPLFVALSERHITPFWRSIPRTLIPDQSAISQMDALEDIVFIGFPGPVWDTHNFLPVIRRGITATPVALDYLGQKQFLIDASVFKGSSGSPVFLLSQGVYANRAGEAMLGNRLFFLGVVKAVHTSPEFNELKLVPVPVAAVPGVVSERFVNLGLVVKSSKVNELIEEWLVGHGFSLKPPPAPPESNPTASKQVPSSP